MGRQLSLTKVDGMAPFADGGLKLSKSIQVSEIEAHEKFRTLFKIDEDVLQRITSSMKRTGFDASQPVHIWKHTDDVGTTHNYLIDGYTRLSACKEAGITSVPYYEDKFDTEEQAFMHVLHLQVDRRNLAPEELLKFIEELMGSEHVKHTKGRTSEVIAGTLGLSPRTVQKAINVIENGDEETKEKIASGEMTINRADKEIQKRKKKSEMPTRATAFPTLFLKEIQEIRARSTSRIPTDWSTARTNVLPADSSRTTRPTRASRRTAAYFLKANAKDTRKAFQTRRTKFGKQSSECSAAARLPTTSRPTNCSRIFPISSFQRSSAWATRSERAMRIGSWNDFLRLAKNMREAQKHCFKTRTGMNECKRLEKEFDEAITHIERCRMERAQRTLF